MTDDIYRRYIRHVNDKIAVFIVRYGYNLFILLDTDTIRLFKVTTYEVSSTSASTGDGVKHTSKYKFDSDSYMIGIDNHVSRCISNDINHFITALTPTPRSYLRGIPVDLKVQGEGALVWHIDDYQGRSHRIKIKNCVYVLGLPSCLASPRHWADQVDDHYPRPDGTWCATYAKNCMLQWDRTIPMNGTTNTPKLYSTPGCNKYRLIVVELELLAQTSEFEVYKSFSDESLLRLDSDEDDGPPEDCEATDESVLEGDATNEDNIEVITDFLSPNTLPKPDEVDQDAETSALSDKGEFLRWNFRLGHLSYPKIKVLVLLGWLPRKLLKVRPPMCAFCGRVSPQFHVQLDEFFETIALNDRTHSKWKRVAGFYSYNLKKMSHKPVKNIFRREVGHQLATTNVDSPIIPNIEADNEEITPLPEGEDDDPSFQR